jgi:hypothetical protein
MLGAMLWACGESVSDSVDPTGSISTAGPVGVAPREASGRLESQEAFGGFLESLVGLLGEERHGAVYAGAALLREGGLSGVVYFKGEVPIEVTEALERSGLGGVSLVGGMEFSQAEAVDRSRLVHEAANRLGFVQVASSTDIHTQRVSLEIGRSDGSLPLGEELLSELVAEVRGGPDGGRYRLDSSDIELVLIDLTPRVAADNTGLEIHHQMTADSGGNYRAQGNTELRVTNGDGWELIGVERFAGGPSRVAVATSPLSLDRLWIVYGLLSPRPDLNFDAEMLLALSAVVSGSCPDLAFDGLVIADAHVYAVFEEMTGTALSCTDDGNHVTFLFVVDRETLPNQFELTAEPEPACATCRFDSVTVDQSDLASLEAVMWGPGRWEISIAGTPPQPGTYNAVLFDSGTPNALLFSPNSWEEFRGIIQGIPSDRVTVVEGFVAVCDGDQCEECLGAECDLIERLGEGCTLAVEPTLYVDGIVTVTFDGRECAITIDTHK